MGAAMKRVIDLLASTLAPDERDAVLGDLAESNATGAAAIRDLLGLVLRRQAALWTNWRPWLALAGMAIPFGILLTFFSMRSAHNSAIYLWMYANNWDPALWRIPAFRHDLIRYATDIVVSWLGLALWSWTAGRALASASIATRHVNAAILALLLFSGIVSLTATGRPRGANDAVFNVTFYRVAYPLIVKTVLVMIPCCLGMRKRGTT
jgi:hypothetical protein